MPSKFIIIISIFILLVSIIFAIQLFSGEDDWTKNSQGQWVRHGKPTALPQVGEIYLSANNKAKIDDWIIKNDLNQFGDSKDTFYAGGTPLFNEGTGKTIDKYQYIIKNHPDFPWDK